MDIILLIRVLRRFWLLATVGVLLTVGVAFLSLARVDFAGGGVNVQYRASEQWLASTTLFISRAGFPWGSAIEPGELPSTQLPTKTSTTSAAPNKFAAPTWYSDLAVLYARLVDSDPVKAIMRQSGPIDGKVVADPVTGMPNGNGAVLPLVAVAGIASTPDGARDLSQRAAAALQQYVLTQQELSAIPVSQRVQVNVVKDPVKAELFKGRPLTAPIVVFVAGLLATFGLIAICENVGRRLREVAATMPENIAEPPVHHALTEPTGELKALTGR